MLRISKISAKVPASVQGISGILMPGKPTFDKVMALNVAFSALGREVPVEFYASSDPSDPVISKYRNLGWYLLDVGENKYQTRGTGSALETVVQDFKVVPNKRLQALVAVVNKNNRTGYLKAGRERSIVWLMREAYKVGRESQHVVSRLSRLFQSVFANSVFWKLMDESDNHLFDFSRLYDLCDHMARNGQEKWWSQVHKEVEAGIQQAKEQVEQVVRQGRDFFIKQNGETYYGLSVFVDNPQVTRELFNVMKSDGINRLLSAIFGKGYQGDKKYAVLLISNSKTGNRAILSSRKGYRVSFAKVAQAIWRAETNARAKKDGKKGRQIWFYDNRIEAVLNGSDSWRAPRTRLPLGEIKRHIWENVEIS